MASPRRCHDHGTDEIMALSGRGAAVDGALSSPSPRSWRGEGRGEGLSQRYGVWRGPLTRRVKNAPTSPRPRGEVRKESPSHDVIAQLPRIGEVRHLPAVEVVFRHAIL